jgi:hypothetical protein
MRRTPVQGAATLVLLLLAQASAQDKDFDLSSMMGGMGMGGAGGMGGMGMGGASQPEPEPNPADIPLILCAACKATVRRAYHVANELRTRQKTLRPTEEQLATAISPICDTSLPAGDWLAWYDMQEQPDRSVVLKRMPVRGECGVECKTAAAACQSVLDAVDVELAEALFRNNWTSKQLEQHVCGSADGAKGTTYELEGACSKPIPLAPEDRPEGPAFIRAAYVQSAPPRSAAAGKEKKGKKRRKGKADKEEM